MTHHTVPPAPSPRVSRGQAVVAATAAAAALAASAVVASIVASAPGLDD